MTAVATQDEWQQRFVALLSSASVAGAGTVATPAAIAACFQTLWTHHADL